jgi:hypothetical protein
VPITVSVGIAPTSAERYEESIAAARAALADARRKGIRRTSSAPEPRVSHDPATATKSGNSMFTNPQR